MDKQKRILIFAHDGRGLGHLRRLSRIASALQGEASVLFVTGHRDASYLVPPECEFVHIPSLDTIDHKRSKYWGRRPFLENDTARGHILRRELISACVSRFQPHGFISDYLPLGIGQELHPLITASPSLRKYFIIRGVLDDPHAFPNTLFTPASLQILREYYDHLIVTCDRNIVDVCEEYSLPCDLQHKISYVGYAVEPYDIATTQAIRRDRRIAPDSKWVVCCAGGGKDGESLMQKCWELSMQYPECTFDLIVGPRSRIFTRDEWHSGTRVRIQQRDTVSMPYRLSGADIVICRGGYNSLMEAAVGQAHIIVVPTPNDYEQLTHAKRLSPFRPITLVEDIDELDLSFGQLLNSPSTGYSVSTLNTCGIPLCSRLIIDDLKQSFTEQAIA